jgi:hypothetical protein
MLWVYWKEHKKQKAKQQYWEQQSKNIWREIKQVKE